MAITAAEGREEILGELGEALERLALATQRFMDAFEVMTAGAQDRLEAELYMPAQKAFGRGKRTYSQFAAAHGFPERSFSQPAQGAPSHGVKGLLEQGVFAAAEADQIVAEIQDSGRPIEFGDAELRAGLAEVRAQLGKIPAASREFLRTLGR